MASMKEKYGHNFKTTSKKNEKDDKKTSSGKSMQEKYGHNFTGAQRERQKPGTVISSKDTQAASLRRGGASPDGVDTAEDIALRRNTSRATYEQELTAAKKKSSAARAILTDEALFDNSSMEENLRRLQESRQAKNNADNIEKKLDIMDLTEKWGNTAYREIEDADSFGDKWDNFWSQTGANIGVSRLSLETNRAFAEYAKNPTEENKQYALQLRNIRDTYAGRNADVMDDEGAILPWISQSGARYLPQLGDQIKGVVGGGAIGGVIGAGIGSFAGPGGTAAGWKIGKHLGASVGSGASMYDVVKGAAVEGLVDEGVDIETASRMARDEGFLSAAIEAMETGGDIAVLSKLGWKGFALAYFLNIVSEMLQEGMQQGVSIATIDRAKRGEEISRNPILSMLDLAGDSMGTLLGAIWNPDSEEAQEIWEAAKEGGKISAIMGGVTRSGGLAAGYGVSKAVEAKNNRAMDNIGSEYQIAAEDLVNEGLSFEEGTEAHQTAQKLRAKLDAGETVSNKELAVLAAANDRAIGREGTPTRTDVTPTVAENETVQPVNQALMEAAEAAVGIKKTEAVPFNVLAKPNADTALPTAMDRRVRAPIDTLPSVEKKAVKSYSQPKYGESGMSAFQTLVDTTDMDAAEVRSKFENAYQAGLADLPRHSIHIVNRVQEMAYNAGRQDYIKTLSDNKRKGVAVWDKKGGVIDNDLSAQLDSNTRTTLHKIGAATGTKILMDESLRGGDANGYYENGVIHISPDAVDPVMVVMKHELTHHLQVAAPKAYVKFRNYAMQKMNANNPAGAMTHAEAKQNRYYELSEGREDLTTEEAMDEIAAEMTEWLLSDEKNLREFIDDVSSSTEHRSWAQPIFDAIHDFIEKVKSVFSKSRDMTEADQVAMHKYGVTFEQLVKAEELWKQAVTQAARNTAKAQRAQEAQAISEIKAGDEGAVYEENGKKFSIKSLSYDIAEGKMFDDLVAAKVFTAKEANLLRENLTKLIEYMLPNASILDMNEAYTRGNRPFAVYKPNSDPLYVLSLDFSTLCRKRLMTQYVIEQLQLRENRPMSAEEQIAIRSMLLDYRRHEKALQVACAMCYVEAARLKAPKQMEKFFNETESIMRKHFAKKDKVFNAKVREAQAQFKTERGYAADATKKDMSGKDTKALNEMSARMRKEYVPDAEQQAIIDTAVSLPRSTFLTAANLTKLSVEHPEIYDAYTSHIRASTRSKSLESGVPYYYGDSRGPVSDSFIESVNAENGMRFDSWSDFQMQHMLDMITAVIDLSVRKSKMHGYTKFPEMVRIFGKTGMMFNLSGVADAGGLDANGNLLFSDTESIDINEAIKLRKAFPETAGLQCIGVSNDHIRALLCSEHIDYVIPYHTSGMNATLRKMAGIHAWKDYTSTQHARKNPNAKKPANAINWQVEPVWSEFYVAEGKDGYDIMQKTAQRYVDMCRERGLIPKFDQFLDEEGYWKLLVDRKMVNQKTGQIIEQKPVKPIFDFELIKREIDSEVSQYDPQLEQRALKHIVDNFDAVHQHIKDLKKGQPKKAMATMANQLLQAYAEGSKVVSFESTQSGKKFSLKGDLTDTQQKNYDYNQKQTVTGTTLKTLKGSPIKRSKYGVGKEIGGTIYLHKQYATDVIPVDTYRKAENILRSERPGFRFNSVMWNPTTGAVRFDEAPDFDTAREPVVGDTVTVNPATGAVKDGHSDYIWHHKWTWVKNDYRGFDVREAWDWSKKWLSTLPVVSDGNGIGRWNAQLDAYGLPRDNSARPTTMYSLKEVAPVQPSSDKWQRGHTEAWFVQNGFPLYRDVSEEQAAANAETGRNTRGGKHGTQITSTKQTYDQLFKLLQDEHPGDWRNLRVLDASSGLGLGTRIGRSMGFNVTDIEPFPSESDYMYDKAEDGAKNPHPGHFHPDYTDYSVLQQEVEDGTTEGFDFVISNAVLNVIPQDTRDNLVAAMGALLKPGGQMFINVISRNYDGAIKSKPEIQRNAKGIPTGAVRTAEGDYSTGGNNTGRGHETFVWKSNSVQKVFSYNELVAYLEDALGAGFAVEPYKKLGMTAALVTKGGKKFSLKDSEGNELTQEQAEYFKDSVVRDKNGNLLTVYHGTNQGDFTEFMWDKTQRADGGFYGRGHYFTASKGMAEIYGSRVLKGYLNITKPFVWQEEVNSYNGRTLSDVLSRNMAVRINLARLFPELFGENAMEYGEYNDRTGDMETKSIKWRDLEKEIAKSAESLKSLVFYDGSVQWAYPGRFWDELVGDRYANKDEAENHKFEAAAQAFAETHQGIARNMTVDDQTTWTQDYGDEISSSLMAMGYDGAMQDRDGTEIVAFRSNQFKSVDNKTPTSDPDIRYSLKDSSALNREIERIIAEGAKTNKSEEEIQTAIRSVVGRTYRNMVKEYGAIDRGEKPYREAKVPRKSGENERVSESVRTILEARVTPTTAMPTIKEMTAKGEFSYERLTNEQAMADADAVIRKKKFPNAYAEWVADVKSGKVNAANTALGWALYNNAVNSGDMDTAMNILVLMVGHQRNAAQSLQASRILKKLTPEAQLYSVVKTVDDLQEEIDKKNKKKTTKRREAARAVDEARGEAAEETKKAVKDTKVRYKGGRVVVEGNQAGEPFVFEYAQKVGEAMADKLEKMATQAKKQKTFLQQITEELTRFGKEKMPKTPSGEKALTATDLLRDYIQNQAFYNEAWENAQVELRQRHEGDARFIEFINSGIGVDAKHDVKNVIFTRALVKAAADTKETKSMIVKQGALGFAGMSETIADQLIRDTGATGEMADTIRDAAAAYVADVLRESDANTEKLIDASIREALKDIGETLTEIVKQGAAARTTAKQAIIQKLIGKYGFGMAEASHVADVVGERFETLAKQRAESILEARFKPREYNRKSIPEMIADYGKLGAFDIGSAYNERSATKIFKSDVILKINEDLAQRFLEAQTQEERDEILKDIYRDIGSQMPASWVDKWNAWRYMAMLTNPTTHVRNFFGNAFFAPVVVTKDMAATIIEGMVHFASKGKIGRTKAIPNAQLLKAAWDDYDNAVELIMSGGKYSDSDMKNRYIQEGRRIFKTKALETIRTKNSEAMETEDSWFARPHYALALAQYCKANGVTIDQLRRGKALGNAREYAVKEAQKATYRDTNELSEFIGGWGRYHGDNKVAKAGSMVMEGILPFRKTPANILVRGLEYSPVGIGKALWQVARGEATAAEVIDSLAAGLTGTGLVVLGAWLAAEGLVRGSGGDDDDEVAFEELQGHQAYSLELPNGTSATLDWLAPEVLPFFVGVNLYERMQESEEAVTMSDMITAISNVTEPLREMSCLQSLNDVFDSVGYASAEGLDGWPSALASAATSYLTQAFPTLLGKFERASEEERMTTYTEKNAFLTGDMQYTLGKVSGKVPGRDYNQIPYIDAWGRTESNGSMTERMVNNLLNPAYMSEIQTSEMEAELQRLHDLGLDGTVLPSRAQKYFNIGKERKDLTAEEYVKYAAEKGQRSYDLLTEITSLPEYEEASDDLKVDMVEMAYEYANAVAKMSVSDYEPTGWVASALNAQDNIGMSETEYILWKTALSMVDEPDKNGEYGGSPTTREKAAAIDMMGNLSDKEIAYLWDTKSGYEAYDLGADMKRYVEYLGNGGNVDTDTLGKVMEGGFNAETYYDYLDARKKFDEPNSKGNLGTYTNEEKENAIRSLGLGRRKSSDLWLALGENPKSNPF